MDDRLPFAVAHGPALWYLLAVLCAFAGAAIQRSRAKARAGRERSRVRALFGEALSEITEGSEGVCATWRGRLVKSSEGTKASRATVSTLAPSTLTDASLHFAGLSMTEQPEGLQLLVGTTALPIEGVLDVVIGSRERFAGAIQSVSLPPFALPNTSVASERLRYVKLIDSKRRVALRTVSTGEEVLLRAVLNPIANDTSEGYRDAPRRLGLFSPELTPEDSGRIALAVTGKSSVSLPYEKRYLFGAFAAFAVFFASSVGVDNWATRAMEECRHRAGLRLDAQDRARAGDRALGVTNFYSYTNPEKPWTSWALVATAIPFHRRQAIQWLEDYFRRRRLQSAHTVGQFQALSELEGDCNTANLVEHGQLRRAANTALRCRDHTWRSEGARAAMALGDFELALQIVGGHFGVFWYDLDVDAALRSGQFALAARALRAREHSANTDPDGLECAALAAEALGGDAGAAGRLRLRASVSSNAYCEVLVADQSPVGARSDVMAQIRVSGFRPLSQLGGVAEALNFERDLSREPRWTMSLDLPSARNVIVRGDSYCLQCGLLRSSLDRLAALSLPTAEQRGVRARNALRAAIFESSAGAVEASVRWVHLAIGDFATLGEREHEADARLIEAAIDIVAGQLSEARTKLATVPLSATDRPQIAGFLDAIEAGDFAAAVVRMQGPMPRTAERAWRLASRGDATGLAGRFSSMIIQSQTEILLATLAAPRLTRGRSELRQWLHWGYCPSTDFHSMMNRMMRSAALAEALGDVELSRERRDAVRRIHDSLLRRDISVLLTVASLVEQPPQAGSD